MARLRSQFSPLLLIVAVSVACSDDPAPASNDTGPRSRPRDLGVDLSDSQIILDSGIPIDSGVAVDTGIAADTGLGIDAPAPDATADAGFADAAPMDAEPMDAQPTDALPADTGPAIPDSDGDTISDADEGNGVIDVDADGIPDSLDTDSDNDGIPDAVEAGDTDPATPPIDFDGDGIPDFRDLDSDNDGVFDRFEGLADPDNDGIPAYHDDDSDGDTLPDAIEGGTDVDGDGLPNSLDLDSDGDGIPDAIELDGDPDNDTLPNFVDDDSDGDGIPDAIELLVDPDNDNIPAYLDLDSDGDGILDEVEGVDDTDMDGVGNWLDLDSDGDTIRDDHDGATDVDGDGVPNFLDLDSDGDGLSDMLEAGDTNLNTPPRNVDFDAFPDFLDVDSDNDRIADVHEGIADTDMDGIPDRHDIDSDNDSILDDFEGGDTSTTTLPIDTDLDMIPDFRDTDSDNDTILDIVEGTLDPDGDMNPNFRDRDSDGDTVTDDIEAGDNDPLTPPVDTDMDNVADYLDLDSDGDGLADAVEPGCPVGPSRVLADSDSDSFPDPAEIAYGSNPCDAGSIIDDFYFVLPPGGPGDDDDLVFSNTGIDRADMAINVDTTGSMQGEIDNLRNSLSGTIIPGVNQAIPDLATGVTSFEDFPVSPFGSAGDGDRPFRLGTRITTSVSSAQNAVNQLSTRNGVDTPESGLEALYQIASGAGTSWPGGSVPAFNPNQGRIPGVADGTIGGVGFRTDALPIVVHVTDAPSHEARDYNTPAGINAASTTVVDNSLAGIGARVVTISGTRLTQLPPDPFTGICNKSEPRFFGRVDYPIASETDWFVLSGASAGDQVTIETFGWRLGSGLDTLVGIYNGTGQLTANDDFQSGHFDSRATVTLTGVGPYYVSISSWGDGDHNATGAFTAGWWFAEVSVNNAAYTPNPTACRGDDADRRTGATPLVPIASAALPPDVQTCANTCADQLPQITMPYGMAASTRAVIPPCAWDAFGGGRPAGCGVNQCCTGLAGAGVAPSAPGGLCPLNFQIQDNGAGIDAAMVTAIQALVNFSAFTITTEVRPDPAELASSGLDTTCFIHGVIPTTATPPNACAPQPTAVDLVPPSPELDSWENVVPGTILAFQVNALNVDDATSLPCVQSAVQPQLFRAFIDVVADGVTVVDTRDVIIIVPPLPPTGSN